jgi:hypothetical protein
MGNYGVLVGDMKKVFTDTQEKYNIALYTTYVLLTMVIIAFVLLWRFKDV